jgi:predicted ATP-dependent serine protease
MSDEECQSEELLRLADVQPAKIDWLWAPYLPLGMVSLLSGDPGCGTTYLALAIAAKLTVGLVPRWEEPWTPTDVLYLSAEDSPEYVLRPRLDALGGDANRLHLLPLLPPGNGNDPANETPRGYVQVLDRALRRTQARLLIVDSFQSFLEAAARQG